jgi:cation transport ATPase
MKHGRMWQLAADAPKLRQSPARRFWESVTILHRRRISVIAVFAAVAILVHLVFRFVLRAPLEIYQIPLLATLVFGGIPLVYELARNLLRREFGSDLLAGISIITSVLLHEYLAGSIVVLMLSGGEALENYALRNASSVLRALANRMPAIAHRRKDSVITDVALDHIVVGDTLVVYPHEICPVDGTVIEGNGVMNEAYLTGEPFEITKAPGSAVISGAVNGETALTITARRRAVDSRYAKIMEVMRESEQNQPRLRRLGEHLGAIYTPIAVTIALLAWAISGSAVRFLAVLVIATPCPLLIAIPVAIIGSISLCARRALCCEKSRST